MKARVRPLTLSIALPTGSRVAPAAVPRPAVLVACAALAAALVVAIRLELPARPFRLLRHRDRYRTRAAEAFSESLNRSANPA